MNNLTAIIVDDEAHSIKTLQNDLKAHCSNVKILATYSSAEEGLHAILEHNPDLVFLDIEMPGIDGISMLERLPRPLKSNIIFTTAYDQYAARAFRLSAVDYLLKPIDKDELVQAVAKVSSRTNTHQIDNLIYNNQVEFSQKRIALPGRSGYEFIGISSIIYCKAEGAYTLIVNDKKQEFLISRALGDVAEMLDSVFFQRIHNSYIINTNYLSKIVKNDGGGVVMSNGTELPISRLKKEGFFKRMGIK
ncbi:MAG: response regulator transcription factor [Pedobacter sp.]|nr:MAG: response regulator transcription factor [Pedobacter sp.]